MCDKCVRMCKGLGNKQLLALSFLLDRHGKAAPEPVPDEEVRALNRRMRPVFARLCASRHVALHRLRNGELWWTLTRKGLQAFASRRIGASNASVGAYLRGLIDAGM